MDHAIFGKAMRNVKNHRNIKPVTTQRRKKKLFSVRIK